MAEGTRIDDRGKALLLALAGFAILSVGDAVVKTMAGDWPGSAVAALRYGAGAAGLAFIMWRRGGRRALALSRPGLQWARGAAVAAATLGFFMGVMVMPLADATAIVFTSPVWTVILSAILLRERPGPGVLVSIALALAGALVILRPNVLAFGPEALFPLLAAFGMSALILLNRRAAGAASAFAMQYMVAATAAPILIALTIAGHASGIPALHVPAPDWTVVLRCTGVAVSATFAHWLIFRATEHASAALVAPMTYVQLIVAMGAGMLLFGDMPGAAMLAGAALIIAGGLYLWWRQGRG